MRSFKLDRQRKGPGSEAKPVALTESLGEPVAERESRWTRFRRRRAEREALRAAEVAFFEQERDRLAAERLRIADEESLRKRQAREQRKLNRRRATPEATPDPPDPKEEPIAPETPPAATTNPGSPPHAVIDERTIRAAAEREALARLERAERRPERAEEIWVEPPGAGEQPVESGWQAAQEDLEVELWIERARAAAAAEQPEGPARQDFAHPVGETLGAPVEEPEPAPVEEPRGDRLLADLARAEGELESRRDDEQELARELELAESRLAESQRRTASAIERATAQLEEVEGRARQAEQRAQRAERLAELKTAESEQAGRLEEMLDRIAAAEDRASSAESRARDAVSRASEPIENPGQPRPEAAASVAINTATLNELLALGCSALEGGSLLEHRDRVGGFTSLDQLDEVPAVRPDRISELKRRVRI